MSSESDALKAEPGATHTAALWTSWGLHTLLWISDPPCPAPGSGRPGSLMSCLFAVFIIQSSGYLGSPDNSRDPLTDTEGAPCSVTLCSPVGAVAKQVAWQGQGVGSNREPAEVTAAPSQQNWRGSCN